MTSRSVRLRNFLNVVLFYACFVETQCKCSTTFITTCEKTADIARSGKQTWRNLIIANDQCSKGTFGSPDEVLNNRAFNKALGLEEMYIVEKLSEIQPGAFDGLDQLTYLKLHQNAIKVIPRGAFSNLTQLRKLDLQHNSVENLAHGLFANSSITSIDLSHNKINNLQVDMVDIPSLRRLTITHNDISSIAPNCFHRNLEYLNLDNNKLNGIDAAVISPLENLKELVLSNNHLSGIAVSFALPSLEKLDLSHNEIAGIQDGSFSEFPELKYLYLGHNRISFLSASLFSEANYVQVMHVHDNALMLLDSQLGSRLSRLQEMAISGNPWACPCLNNIATYFVQKNIRQPDCEKNFFVSGESPICTVTGDVCTGEENLTKADYDNFRASQKYSYC